MLLFLPDVVAALGFFSMYQELAHLPAFVLALFSPHSAGNRRVTQQITPRTEIPADQSLTSVMQPEHLKGPGKMGTGGKE